MSAEKSFVEKANKGRCLAFPGYCDKTIATCELAHPLVNCDRYPKCLNPKCTYLHPVCNIDCKKQLCKKSKCIDYHPWRDSYRAKKNKLPDPSATDIDEFAVIPDSSIVKELIVKYQKEHEESSPSIERRVTPSQSYAAATVKTQQSDNPSMLEDEIMKVWKKIVELNYHETIRDKRFSCGKCFDCRKSPATIVLLNCSHLVFCKRCFESNRKCLLCGKIFEGHIDVES